MKAYTTTTQDRIDLALDILHALLITPFVWLFKLVAVGALILAPVALGELLFNLIAQ